jgi:galactose mutarotase-like enzyme
LSIFSFEKSKYSIQPNLTEVVVDEDKLYKIQNGGTEVTVSERGGTITSFISKGKEIFYPWREEGGKMRGGCPICAPWFGSSPRGEKKHGHLRNIKPFDVVHTDSGVVLKFIRAQDELYPWAMQYSVVVVIYPDGALYLSLVMKRLGDYSTEPAPVLPGFHPYFSCRKAEEVRLNLAGENFSGFSDHAKPIPFKSRYALIEMPERTIEMKFGKKQMAEESQLVLWTDLPNQFVCIEPILENKNLFDTPGGCHLEEGEWLEIYMVLNVLDSK